MPGHPHQGVRRRSLSSSGIRYAEPWPDVERQDLVSIRQTTCRLGRATIAGLKALLDDLKGRLDGMNEMSEMTSLRLQMTMDRRSKLLSTLSQLMKKCSTTQDTLIQNIK